MASIESLLSATDRPVSDTDSQPYYQKFVFLVYLVIMAVFSTSEPTCDVLSPWSVFPSV